MPSRQWHPLKAKKESARRVRSRRVGFVDPETLQVRKAQEAVAAKGITQLVTWFEARGFEVRFGRRFKDEIFYGLKRVKICTRPSLQSQLIGLLHEAGHLLVASDRRAYERRFGRGWPAADSKNKTTKRSLVHRVQVLEEELEAWNRGQRLGVRLRVKVNGDMWTQVRYTCLAHYARYATQHWEMQREPVTPVPAP